jgi:hypothetical protein
MTFGLLRKTEVQLRIFESPPLVNILTDPVCGFTPSLFEIDFIIFNIYVYIYIYVYEESYNMFSLPPCRMRAKDVFKQQNFMFFFEDCPVLVSNGKILTLTGLLSCFPALEMNAAYCHDCSLHYFSVQRT